MRRAYVQSTFAAFQESSVEEILGQLVTAHGLEVDVLQRNAWAYEIRSLQRILPNLGDGYVLIEVAIPRMGKRADVILLLAGFVFVLEYKVGASEFVAAAVEQVQDYALDLKNFHAGSHHLPIVPILVATEATQFRSRLHWSDDFVALPLVAGETSLLSVLEGVLAAERHTPLDVQNWLEAGYLPTPTIIEAASALYAGHSVADIARSEASGRNLLETATAIRKLIAYAKEKQRKAICFVTGVPGSGKTLAGLNLATEAMSRQTGEHAVFLSGNGPLVEVLTEALARDEWRRTGCKKDLALRRAKTFIQNIHHFRDEGLRTNAAPAERVVIFDEAQRAWDREQTSRFMRQKRGLEDFDSSEPEYLLSVMDRHADWCVVVCLVGGGQEINTGESGLPAWSRAVRERFPSWVVAMPAATRISHYDMAFKFGPETLTLRDPGLHLGVSLRSYRAELVAEFVSAILDGDLATARTAGITLSRYPMRLTRSLGVAKEWLRSTARGSERYGLVASSNALRLKPEGLHINAGIDTAEWFLAGKDDVRSAYALEDVASEFEVQGLELDWVCVCWDANLRWSQKGWSPFRFRGTRWESISDSTRVNYLLNSYRVLLTRARQGMVIYVPKGDARDRTRMPEFYDATFAFLRECGMFPLE